MSNTIPECILLFARTPVKGKVKTRLETGMPAADVLELYRCMTEDTVHMLLRCRAQLIVCFTPADEKAQMRQWLGSDLIYQAQNGDHLGARMRSAFLTAFDNGFKHAVCVGTDIPELRTAIIHSALDAVGDGHIPLGPAADGGYYLIGCGHQRIPDAAFGEHMPWGAGNVFDLTAAALVAEGFGVRQMPMLQDMDTFEALREYYGRTGDRAGKTGAFLKGLFD